jgi:hypothetical protein
MKFAYAVLEKLKQAPGTVRSFFTDPVLRYIRDCAA